MWHGVAFLLFASSALILLYLFKDYLYPPFFVLICLSSSAAVATILEDAASALCPKVVARANSPNCPHINTSRFLCGRISLLQLMEVIIGGGVVISWVWSRNWMLNNAIAACLSLTFFKTIRLNSVLPGVFLLSLLFCYDIFFVFVSPALTNGTSIMIAVASTVDAPIMLKMPRMNASPSPTCGILGLGDIVIPGLYLMFLKRFGDYVHSKAYIVTGMTLYGISLLICGAVLWVFGHG